MASNGAFLSTGTKNMRLAVRKLWQDTTGATAPEYALILAVILVATVGAFEVLGNRTSVVLGTAIQSVSPGAAGEIPIASAGPQAPIAMPGGMSEPVAQTMSLPQGGPQ